MAKAEMEMECAFKHEFKPSRKMIAAMCLQGILACDDEWDAELNAEAAVHMADALIAELERTEK